MNVVNDKTSPGVSPPIDFFLVITFVLFTGVSFSTFLLAPLPLLFAHSRLPEPWAKISAILGSVVAVVFLKAPVPWVLVAFVLSMVFVDRFFSQKSLFQAFALATSTALVSASGLLVLQSRLHSVPLSVYWEKTVSA
jgi:hypothetical protein